MYRGSRIFRVSDIFVARHFSSLFSPLSKQETCTVKHVARPPAGACRGNVQPPAAALALGNVQPPAAALARTHAGIRYGRRLAALTRDKVPPQAGRTCEHMRAEHAILISCEHSLLAGEACLQTNVSMHSEREFMQARHASIPARGARGSGGG